MLLTDTVLDSNGVRGWREKIERGVCISDTLALVNMFVVKNIDTHNSPA